MIEVLTRLMLVCRHLLAHCAAPLTLDELGPALTRPRVPASQNVNTENYLLTPAPEGDLCVAKLYPPDRSGSLRGVNGGGGASSSGHGAPTGAPSVRCEAGRGLGWRVVQTGIQVRLPYLDSHLRSTTDDDVWARTEPRLQDPAAQPGAAGRGPAALPGVQAQPQRALLDVDLLCVRSRLFRTSPRRPD